jgi:hypothetical protein
MCKHVDTPGILVAASVVLSCLIGCATLTHRNNELAAYAADDGLCVTEAQDHDPGTQCLDKYQRLYSVFWEDSGYTVCRVPVSDGGDQ